MKRSELYARVWAEPMIRVAADLGLSGPGLAKLCARSGIPTPARGHWAKLKAGKRSRQPPLPQPELDPSIPLPTPAQRERKERKKTFEEGVRAGVSARGDTEVAPASADPGQSAAEPTKPDAIGASIIAVTIAGTLDRPHPLVRATAVAVARLPALLKRWERATPMQRASASLPHRPILRNGRYELDVSGGLALIASLEAMDWILRFLDALFKGLRGQGVRIERTTRKDERVAVLRLAKDGEELVMAPVVEGYKREAVDAQELARVKEEGGWSSKWRYWPSGRMSMSVQGTERIVNANWSGTPDRLEAQLGTMVATCLELMAQQPTHRKEREIEEERQRREEERQYKLRRQREAREEQLKKAFEASEQYEQERRLRRFLAMVERQADQFVEPYPERAKVWLQIVRAQLETQSPWRRTLGECLTGPSWQPWPPRWWPSSEATEEE
jgi:hypothetical protein